MYAIEFWTEITAGTIEIPREIWKRLHRHLNDEPVRVLVLIAGSVDDPQEVEFDLIEQLLTNPLRIPDFVPLSRGEAHE